MNSTPAFVLLTLLSILLLNDAFSAKNQHSLPGPDASGAQTIRDDKLESAYRLNNTGVALLEQYKPKEASELFSRALELKPNLLIAKINLSIALYYLPDAEGAKREAERALVQDPTAPQAHFILGHLARLSNRADDAIAEFQKVLRSDPNDTATNIALGQLYVQQKRQPEAITAFRTAISAEPYNETALYNLGLVLTRTGSREEGQRLIQKFQQLRESGAGTSIGSNYLEAGRYAEAVISKGNEPDLVDARMPSVKFTDVQSDVLRVPQVDRTRSGGTRLDSAIGEANRRAEAVVLFDYDGDGDYDIFDAAGSQRLMRNDGGRFVDVTEGSGLNTTGSQYSFAAVAGDYDNDTKPDLLVIRFNGAQFILFHSEGNGRFSDRTKESGIVVPQKAGAPYLSTAFVDADHDGDLDIFISGPTRILLRNNGDGTFIDITRQAGLQARNDSMSPAVVPTDYDNRRDIDLFVLDSNGPPALFRNMRDGTFRNVAKDVGLDRNGAFWCTAVADVNKDGLPDFFLGADKRGILAISDGRGRFNVLPAPLETNKAMAAQFVDYDNDGLLDLVVITNRGLRLFRNTGQTFSDVSKFALPLALRNLDAGFGQPGMISSNAALASADIDGDGDTDLIMRGAGGQLKFLRNDGGNQNASLKISLRGRVSNRSAIQAKVEMRAGSLWQRSEIYSASPAPAPADVLFGLGKRLTADAVRVVWPAGIIQTETEITPATTNAGFHRPELKITELDRKPSSCPYLYTWNGKRFEFVTDFMGGGEMGYLEELGRYNEPDPEEYVRIRDDQLKDKDGLYELRVTNELEEAVFLDRLQLLVLTHPAETDAYPNEGMATSPKPFKLFMTKNARPPLSAVDDHGHNVLGLVSQLDRRFPNDFQLDPIRGYASQHTLTLELPRSANEKTLLLLTGWTDYAWSSDNMAASQSKKEMMLPALQVKDETGKWQTVIEDIGIPVGRPQTVTVDLTGKLLSSSREVRIVTNMRIYWDQILVDQSGGDIAVDVKRLEPIRSELRWRGFSAEVTPDGREPYDYAYNQISFNSPWKTMTGRYTREGDVRELLLKTDDIFVISRPGDEVSVSFAAGSLPPLPKGFKRTFLLFADGFSKEMDINSASPDQVGPLPFHGMSRYPYRWPERYPMTPERQAYIEKFNTRIVSSSIPSITAAIRTLMTDRP